MRRSLVVGAALASVFALGVSLPVAAAGVNFTLQQRLGFQAGDDWEPALTSDGAGHLYALYKHYDVAGGQTCAGCDRHVLLQRSSDGGTSWTAPRPIAPGTIKGGQYDSQIQVDPLNPRTVWASFLQNFHSDIAVVKSIDGGATWSAPVIASSGPPNKDKDELAVRGDMAVVAYDDNSSTWASVTTDGGATWQVHLVFPHSSQFGISLAGRVVIDSAGRIFVSWASFDQSHQSKANGPATVWVSRSDDAGVTWTRAILDVSGAPPPCVPCGWDFLGPQMTLAIGAGDNLYALWNASAAGADGAPERIYLARSTDHGLTFSPAVDVSDAQAGVEHSFPALTVGSDGRLDLAWMDTRTGSWNLFFRQSADGGVTFGPAGQVSTFVPGYAYLTPSGFGLPYGDYFSMAPGRNGAVDIAFGEGPSYAGPGNIWFAQSR